MDYKDLCHKVCILAKEVGQFIKSERQNAQINIEVKGSNDFVTQVDKASESRIINDLKSILPEAGFIAEEGTETLQGEQYNWIIDPIDGTTNFIHGLYPYAISIALKENDKLVVGVVYEVGFDECFYAWKDGGAFLNGDNISVSRTATVKDSLIATGFPFTNFQRLDGFMNSIQYFMENSRGLRRLGSAATDLAYVACGRFDSFYEYNLKPWDVAAGAIIIQEAGGSVCDFDGGGNYLFGQEIIATNNNTFNEFKAVVKKLMN